MKKKRTIRKQHSPVARDLMRIANGFEVLAKRVHAIADKVEDQDAENRALRAEVNGLRQKMLLQSEALRSGLSVAKELGETCLCGHFKQAHFKDGSKDTDGCHFQGCTCMSYEEEKQ